MENNYPDGIMLKTEKATYYLRGGKKIKVYSNRALKSWGIKPTKVSEADLAHLPTSKFPLGFRDGTLIHNIADGKLYIISAGKRRHITSPEVLERIGKKRRDAVTVSRKEAELHDEGAPLE